MRVISLLMVFIATTVVANPSPRLLSAGSNVTELVLALDAEPQLVAVDSTSELPPNSNLPTLGYHRQLSAEGILSTKPDMIIGSEEMGPERALTLVRQAGVTVVTLPTATTVSQLNDNIEQLGQLLDKPKHSQRLQHAVTQRAAALSTHNHNQGKSTVFLLLGDGNTMQIAGQNTLADRLITLAGGQNPATEQVTGYKPIAAEAVVALAPEVILISKRTLANNQPAAELLRQFPLLRHTPAAQHSRLIAINGKALIGGLGLTTLAEAERLQPMIVEQH